MRGFAKVVVFRGVALEVSTYRLCLVVLSFPGRGRDAVARDGLSDAGNYSRHGC